MHPTPFVRVVGAALAACLTIVACLWALPAAAADTTIRLVDNAFDPEQATITAGDTITWKWAAGNNNPHSVRVDAVAGPALEGAENPVYDSHPNCSGGSPGKCGAAGDSKTWTPSQPGTYRFYCPVHGSALLGMNGTLTVEEAPSPSPSETSPATEPDPEPAKSKTTAPDPEQSTTAQEKTGNSDNENDNESSDEPRSEPTSGTAYDPGIRFGPPTSFDPEPLPTILPSVAPSATDSPRSGATPDLEDFPEARDSETDPDEAGVVAIDDPGGGLPPRTIWLGIGSATILTAAGAFVKLVLFGAPWA